MSESKSFLHLFWLAAEGFFCFPLWINRVFQHRTVISFPVQFFTHIFRDVSSLLCQYWIFFFVHLFLFFFPSCLLFFFLPLLFLFALFISCLLFLLLYSIPIFLISFFSFVFVSYFSFSKFSSFSSYSSFSFIRMPQHIQLAFLLFSLT